MEFLFELFIACMNFAKLPEWSDRQTRFLTLLFAQQTQHELINV